MNLLQSSVAPRALSTPFLVASLWLFGVVASGCSPAEDVGGGGGQTGTGTGGSTGAGGFASGGSPPGSGGTIGSGGAPATGGASGTGGATSTGGASATGGAGTGGRMGSGGMTGAGGRGTGGAVGGGGAMGTGTFAAVTAIFASACVSCHDGTNHTDLRAMGLHARIVNRAPMPSTNPSCTSQMLVVPSMPATSLISNKVKGTNLAGCGARMPVMCSTTGTTPRACLTAAQIMTIDSWIMAGAPM